MKKLFLRAISWGLGASAVAVLVFKLLAMSYAYANATASPEPSTGHTVAVNSHGRTIYLTQAQIESENILHWSNLVLAGLVVLSVAQKIQVGRSTGKSAA